MHSRYFGSESRLAILHISLVGLSVYPHAYCRPGHFRPHSPHHPPLDRLQRLAAPPASASPTSSQKLLQVFRILGLHPADSFVAITLYLLRALPIQQYICIKPMYPRL